MTNLLLLSITLHTNFYYVEALAPTGTNLSPKNFLISNWKEVGNVVQVSHIGYMVGTNKIKLLSLSTVIGDAYRTNRGPTVFVPKKEDE